MRVIGRQSEKDSHSFFLGINLTKPSFHEIGLSHCCQALFAIDRIKSLRTSQNSAMNSNVIPSQPGALPFPRPFQASKSSSIVNVASKAIALSTQIVG